MQEGGGQEGPDGTVISRGTLGWSVHALIFMALIVNLWFGGDIVEGMLGRPFRGIFEIGLILAYMTLVVGMRAPLPWRRPPEGDEAAGGGREEGRRE